MNLEKGNLTFESHIGHQGRRVLSELAELRIEIFREFPYLYDGDLDYETKYLERYFSSQNSFVFCARHNGRIIGSTTAIWLVDEDDMIKNAFKNTSYMPLESVFYFGESLVRSAFRGQGLGDLFFKEREKFAKEYPSIRWTSFCAIVRTPNDPRRPQNYRSPESLWRRMGYQPAAELKTQIEWKELGEKNASNKNMQFWVKPTGP